MIIQQAIITLQELRPFYLQYQEGQTILQRLQKLYGNSQSNMVLAKEHPARQPGKLDTMTHYSGNFKQHWDSLTLSEKNH